MFLRGKNAFNANGPNSAVDLYIVTPRPKPALKLNHGHEVKRNCTAAQHGNTNTSKKSKPRSFCGHHAPSNNTSKGCRSNYAFTKAAWPWRQTPHALKARRLGGGVPRPRATAHRLAASQPKPPSTRQAQFEPRRAHPSLHQTAAGT